jgi:hypothetical protein
MITVLTLCNSAAEIFKAVSAIGNNVKSIASLKNPVNEIWQSTKYLKNLWSNVLWILRKNSFVALTGYNRADAFDISASSAMFSSFLNQRERNLILY